MLNGDTRICFAMRPVNSDVSCGDLVAQLALALRYICFVANLGFTTVGRLQWEFMSN
jgi:hypothetical protein